MKTHEITASKGEFVVVDMPSYVVEFTANKSTFKIGETRCKLICKLSEATDDDAKLIVDEHNHYFNDGTVDYYFRDYRVESEYDEPSRLPFAVDSLKTLLKSKGIDVNNGNWYLFKKT